MSYPIGVGVYLVLYTLGVMLPLVLGSGQSVIRVVVMSVPVLLVGPRVLQRFAGGTPLVPQQLRNQGDLLLGLGQFFVWLGHIAFFGAIGAAFYFAARNTAGIPVGILAGLAYVPYLVGIVIVEIAFRLWASNGPDQAWLARRNSVRILLGLVVATHLGLVLRDAGNADGFQQLGYYEQEALAKGRGYAKEVQRVADRFYEEHGRLPCESDNYVDTESLLGMVNREERLLTITLLGCGEFAVTMHRPIDGTGDGALFYSAAPDTGAGAPALDWQCISAHHERIATYTRDECRYDPSLAARLENPPRTEASTRSPSTLAAAPGRAGQQGLSASQYLEKLAEPVLWENCGADDVIFRLLRFDTTRYGAAAVRVQRESFAGSYRTVTSASPVKVAALDGYVEERTLAPIESRFAAANFFGMQSDRAAGSAGGGRIQIEVCDKGRYHSVQRADGDPQMRDLVAIIERAGRLEWPMR